MIKRNLIKKATVIAAAAAMAVTALPVSAMAASWKTGSTSVTADIYVLKENNPVAKKVPLARWDAYFTSTALPPNKSVANRATLTYDGETATLKIPVDNQYFGIYDDNVFDKEGMIKLGNWKFVDESSSKSEITCEGHEGTRYQTLVYTYDVDAAPVATYSGEAKVTMHGKASLPLFGISLQDVKEEVPVVVSFDLSNAIE